MKLNRKELLEALRFCSAVVPAHSPDGLLQYALLTVEPDRVEITATDRNIQVCRTFPYHTPSEYDTLLKCLLPCKKTVELLSASSDMDVSVKLVKGGVEIVDSTGSYRFVTPALDGFPAIEVLIEESCEVDSAHLSRALPLVGACVDEKLSDEYTLDGFRVESWDGALYLIGTNKAMLCSCRIANCESTGFTVPVRAIRLAAKMEGRLWMGLNSGLVCFSSQNCTLISRTLLDGFPRWEALVQQSRKVDSWGISHTDLTEALRKCSLFTLEESRGVNIEIKPGCTNLKAMGSGMGKCSIDIPSTDVKQRELIINGTRLWTFLSKVSSTLPVQLRAGDVVSASVGDFCDFTMSLMEVE